MTRDDVIRWASEANAPADACLMLPFLERFAAKVAADEREACAQICDDEHHAWRRSPAEYSSAYEAAAAIRKRST